MWGESRGWKETLSVTSYCEQSILLVFEILSKTLKDTGLAVFF
jgi:hypothetical protein